MKIAPIIDALKAAEKRGGPLRYRLIQVFIEKFGLDFLKLRSSNPSVN